MEFYEHLLEDYVFPNEIHVHWSLMIVLYPYITGLVAGAFIVSSLYHVFDRQILRPIARFSLVSSFVFLLFAPLPLLVHLGHPERSFNAIITPHFTSAMSGFGYVYMAYSVVVAIEIWLVFRREFLAAYSRSRGLVRAFYYLLLLGVTEADEAALQLDRRWTKFFAGLGIPLACILHGYVGFLFGSIKANPWWSTPLMFIIFLFSAIVSGIAVLIWLYQFICWLRRLSPDEPCLQALARYLWSFMIVAVMLELMEVLSIAYEQTEEWAILKHLITVKIFWPYVVGQLLVCSLGPFLLLSANSIFRFPRRLSHFFIWISAGALLLQVLLMRWNVVIGGQLISKSYRGTTSYFPKLFEKEGVLTALVIFVVPFLLIRLFDKAFPLLERRPAA
ncbi:MAG: NrfD/PsrC family molybdoenzyme membrane anchor subunit [Planctomycetota bacterium]